MNGNHGGRFEPLDLIVVPLDLFQEEGALGLEHGDNVTELLEATLRVPSLLVSVRRMRAREDEPSLLSRDLNGGGAGPAAGKQGGESRLVLLVPVFERGAFSEWAVILRL